MKNLTTIIVVSIFLLFPLNVFSLQVNKLHALYFEQIFRNRVQQFMKIEFSVKEKKHPSKKLLLKRLKELMDKEAQTI